MISEKLKPLVANNSTVRAMFEEGGKLKEKYGEENVFDFSIGNPNVPAPEEVKQAILDILEEEDSLFVHGYMNNAGYDDVRQTLAEQINKEKGTSYSGKNLIMTVGAGSSLNVALKTVINRGDEVLIFAPYFLEYNWYVDNYDGKVVPVDTKEDFTPDVDDLRKKISDRTKAVIINNPNNPTGVVYDEDVIKSIAEVMYEAQEKTGKEIYIISDEPYRELVYDGAKVPWIPDFYNNTMVGYSYSKTLSLPGERIGYLLIPDEADDAETLIEAATGANRISGCVNAPSPIQRVIKRCADCKADIDFYDRNRKALYNGLRDCGFECTLPKGAFYLWVRSPVEDEREFCKAAKKYNILMVPGRSFMGPGYVRLAYCVSEKTVRDSIDKFRKLAEEYGKQV